MKKVIRPALRRGLAENAVARHGVSIALTCRTFGVSETCYRYSPLLSDENEEIADLLVGLTVARKTWGFGPCFLHLRNVQGHPWNHKRVYRIYCELELNLRIKPRKRLKRDNPDALAVPDAPNVTWSITAPSGYCAAMSRVSVLINPDFCSISADRVAGRLPGQGVSA